MQPCPRRLVLASIALISLAACGTAGGDPDQRLDSGPAPRETDSGSHARQDASQGSKHDLDASVPEAVAPAEAGVPAESGSPDAKPPHAVKWNPGHWMLTYTQLEHGRTLSDVQGELTALSQSPGIVGYKSFVTWAYLEPAQGQYYFTDIDAMIGAGGQFAQMTPERHLILQLNPNVFNSGQQSVPTPGDDRFLPSYILDDPGTYGPAVLGHSGLANPNDYGGFWVQGTGGYAANFVNPNVQARLIALIEAIGTHYDSNPLFEGIILCANDDMYPVSGSGISEGQYLGALQAILSASTAALPTSNVGIQNAWAGEPTASQQFEQWMLEHRVLPASSDTAGEPAWTTSYAPANLSWGVQAWLGVQSPGSTWEPPTPALQSLGHAMMDIQGGDITTPSVYPTAYTPLEITQACNAQYSCSHVFWSYLTASDSFAGFTVPPAAQWPNLLATVQTNPLTSTSYPASYP